MRGMYWSFLERISTQLVTFVVTLIMARLLTPADYGMVGMLLIFIELAQTLCDSGMSQALIREGTPSANQMATAARFQVVAGIGCYLLIWVCSPLIARFYNMPELEWLVKVVALGVPLRAFSILRLTILAIRLDFRKMACVTLAANLIAGGVGIYMAANGGGVLSIAVYQVTVALLTTILLRFSVRLRERGHWSMRDFRLMFGFGSRLMSAGLIDVAYRNMYLPLIGKFYPVADVGYFVRARQMACVPAISLTEIVRRVAYPVLCRCRDDEERLQKAFLKITGSIACLYAPLLLIIGVGAQDIIVLLLGDKWLGAAPLLKILCFGYLFYPIDALNISVIQAAGHSALVLRMEIYKKLIGVGALLLALRFGIDGICIAFAASGVAGYLINIAGGKRGAGLSMRRQLAASLIPMLIAALSCEVVFHLIPTSGFHPWQHLLLGGLGSLVAYAALIALTRLFVPGLTISKIKSTVK